MQPRIEEREIWDNLLNDKDQLSLREMSEKYNVTAGAIVAAFKRQNISRVPAPSGPRAYRKRDDLPPEPEEAKRKRDRRPRKANPPKPPAPKSVPEGAPKPRPGTKDRKLLRFWDELGKLSDAEIALRARVSPQTVMKFRTLHGVPAPERPKPQPRPTARAAKPSPNQRETPSVRRGRELQRILEPFEHVLGVLPDSEVARLAGLSLQAVRHQRQRRGVPAAGKLPRKMIRDLLEEHGFAPSSAAKAPSKAKVEAPKVAKVEARVEAAKAEPVQAEAMKEAKADSAGKFEIAPGAVPPQKSKAKGTPKPAPVAGAQAPEPTPAPQPPAAVATAEPSSAVLEDRQAWRVTYASGDVRIIVAPSFLAAAELAQGRTRTGGDIASVEALGPALAC